MVKRFVSGLALVCCLLGGCALGSRDEAKQTDAHRDETTTVTKVTHQTGTQAGQPVDVTTTETTTEKKSRDDTATSQTHSEVSSPALDKAASSLEAIASQIAGAYIPGAGGVVQSVLHGVGMNTDTAAGLASLGAAGAGWWLHRTGKKKGHAEAKKAPPTLPV